VACPRRCGAGARSHGGRGQREFDATITEQLPDERVVWKEHRRHAARRVVTFHRLSDNETRVTVQLDWQPDSVTEKVGAAAGFDDRRVKRDLKKSKAFIEERGPGNQTGAWRGEVPRP